MIGALLRKEWREHRVVFGLFTLGIAAMMALLWFGETAEEGRMSAFDPYRRLVMLGTTIGAYFVVQRLVTREYGARTQLFLASLPVSRASILALKFLLGLGFLWSLLLLMLLAAVQGDSRPFDAALVSRIAVRVATYALFFHAFFFLGGLLGRFRFAFFVAAVIFLFSLDEVMKLELENVGPFALLGDDFSTERVDWRWKDLLVTGAASTVFTIAGFAVALVREGTLVELLVRRMSHREKVTVSCVLLGMLMAVTILAEKSKKEPFELGSSADATAPGVRVRVALAADADEERARALADALVTTLASAREYLDLPPLPDVFVVPASEHDATVFQRLELTRSHGLVLAANLAEPRLDSRRFLAFALGEVVAESGGNAVARESHRWVLDGFSTWWIDRELPSTDGAVLRARAAEAARRLGAERRREERVSAGADALDAHIFAAWLSSREQLGPCLSEALAAEALGALADAAGDEKTRSILRALLRKDSAEAPREVLARHEVSHSTVTEGLRARLALATDGVAASARLFPVLELSPLSKASWGVVHSGELVGSQDEGARYQLRYARLGAFDVELDESDLRAHDVLAGKDLRHELPTTLARGDRWFFAFDVSDPALGCVVRQAAQRRTIQ